MKDLSTALDLCDALKCDNEEIVIKGFMERYDVSYEEAMDIFEETKKWLWLAAKTGEMEGISLFIDKPLLIIDEMWHNFILHTKQYYKFCLGNFKRFIHHVPTPQEDKAKNELAFSKNPHSSIKEHEQKLKIQYSLIYDHLGSETLLKWYDHMAQKYTPHYIKSIKKG